MNDNTTPKDEQLKATPEELKIISQLRDNPIMAIQIKAIIQKFESEIANGMDANQAEQSLIESLQELGKSMMNQWADNTQKDTIKQAQKVVPNLQKHTKKNSNGPME